MDPDSFLFELGDSLSRMRQVELCVAIFFLIVNLTILVSSSCFESFIISLSPRQIAEFKASRKGVMVRLCTLLQNPKHTVASLLLTHYFASAVVALLSFLGVVMFFAFIEVRSLALLVFALMFVPFLLLFFFGEVLPGLMFEKAEGKCLPIWVINLSYALDFMLSPLAKLLCSFSSIVDKRIEAKTQYAISLDELNETLKYSSEEKAEESEILQGIVNFGRISADEIMKPRVDIVDVDMKCTFSEVVKIIRESEYSRLPVYEESIDNVKGILYIKDVMQYIGENDNFKWQNLIRKAYFVPESKKIDDLLKEFQDKRMHMAIVVDEFGGTAGIVTLEDILEVIVGDICDEHDEDEHKLYSVLDEKHYVIDAKLPLPDFFKIKGIEREKFDGVGGDSDTIAGLLLEMNGDIPAQGSVINHEGYEFKIISADNRRIKKVKLQIP